MSKDRREDRRVENTWGADALRDHNRRGEVANRRSRDNGPSSRKSEEVERKGDRRKEQLGPLLSVGHERRVKLDRRKRVLDEVGSMTPILTMGWGLFCEHLSRPEMPMLIHRDKTFLERYAEKYLHHAYVPWEIRVINALEARSWFRMSPARAAAERDLDKLIEEAKALARGEAETEEADCMGGQYEPQYIVPKMLRKLVELLE